MSDRKRGLGRGLNDLLASSDWLKRDDVRLFFCPVDRLSPNPQQPRQSIDAGLQELAASIREMGVLQPLIVTSEAPGGNSYRIIAGERRWRAAIAAGLTEVPAVLREATSTEALELAIVENVQRRDLNCVEEALAFRRLQEEHGLTQEAIARRVGKDRSTVANLIRLLQLPVEILQEVVDGRISMGHGRALLAAPDDESRLKICETIISRDLSVRQAERLVRNASQSPAPPARTPSRPLPDPESESIQDALRSRFNAPVRVSRKANRGAITISFKSRREFQRILGLLGLAPDRPEGKAP